MTPLLTFPPRIALAACLLALPVAAQAQDTDAGALAHGVFEIADDDGDGQLTLEEMHGYDADVVLSMDLDESGAVELEEFLGWGFGFGEIAEDRGRSESYQTAGRILFSIMDYNGDGGVTLDEMNGFQSAAMGYSDQDESGGLSADEFHAHHFANIAVRTALTTVAE